METVQLYAGEAILDLPASSRETINKGGDSVQYFGSENDYKKTKKYLIWFSISSLVVFVSIGIFIF